MSSSENKGFAPRGDTAHITVAATTASVALKAGGPQQRVMNNGSATAWIVFGSSTIEADGSTSMPIAPGAIEVLTPPPAATHVAAIAAGATGLIYFTPGVGL